MIDATRVTKRFGPVLALDGVSFSLAAGERVALVGTNGSGKTTLLRALCGLLRVDGSIRIGGVDLAERPQLALQSLAYMPQTTPPLEAPVGELVRAYCSLRGSSAACVEERAAQLDLPLPALARTRVRDLSGGMKQKLVSALALSSTAPLLVCDEPTASLDARARSSFFELIAARPSSSSLLLCSHRLDEVRQLVDRVVELKDGRVSLDERLSERSAGVVDRLSAWRAN
jgi:ABC-2 type transport system ATP-binding protein